MMPLFAASELTKAYGRRIVLSLRDLVIESEKIYALQGPNGSGKTTLLEILGLLIPPTAGKLLYRGKKIDFANRESTAVRREIVMVHQNPVLFTTSVKKNLEFGLKIRGVTGAATQKAVEEALDLVGMHGFLHAEAHKLSGGETQRVAIARALVCSPKVILFDEPTSSVDVENRMIIEGIILDINAEKRISVIFTSHDSTQASRLSDDVIPLFEGRKISSPYENIFTASAFPEGGRKIRFLIGKGLELLGEGPAEAGEVKISIDPSKIKLHKGNGHGAEVNHLPGILFQLTDDRDGVRATVDAGMPLNFLIPRETFKDASLTIGDPVTVTIPVDAVSVF